MSTISELFGCIGYTSPNSQLFGLECEIESIYSFDGKKAPSWSITEDGSLRNSGREFISVPLDRVHAVRAFEDLHKAIVFRNELEKFSERTSIHVHANCQNLQEQQVLNIVYLYALFEELFYLQIDPSRRDNIHCVPIIETYLPMYYGTSISTMVARWSKYTGMNLCPLSNYGTIEFRHMHGHNDPIKLNQWLTCIENLIIIAKTIKKFNVSHLTGESINSLATDIFGHLVSWKMISTVVPSLVRNAKLDLKATI